MSRKKATCVKLHLTERALADFITIEAYSIEQWGKRVAAKCLSDIEARLRLLQGNPSLLASVEGFPEVLQCYPAREHVLLFDVQPKSFVLLTVIHGGRDIPSRLGELLPTLTTEVGILHKKLRSRRKR